MKISNYILIILLVLSILLIGADKSTDNSNINEPAWDDSLFLLRNILKDLAKEKKIIEQYKLFIRAESTYKLINNELSYSEAKKFRKKLHIAFRKLPSPSELTHNNELNFKLYKNQSDQFYLSDPIQQNLFVEYLNKKEVSYDQYLKMVHPKCRFIDYDNKSSKFHSNNSNIPVEGLSYYAVRDFASWLSKTRKIQLDLPEENMIVRKTKENINLSYWTKTRWREKNSVRRESWEMFGGEFYTLYISGKKIGELPEACIPNVQIRLISSIKNGKKLYLKNIRSTL